MGRAWSLAPTKSVGGAQLAPAVRDPNGRAYNPTAFLAERRKMMQAWADYLDKLRADVKVLRFKRTAEGA